jgi:hypothetical protein
MGMAPAIATHLSRTTLKGEAMRHSSRISRGLVLVVMTISIVVMLAACGGLSRSALPAERRGDTLASEARPQAAPTMAASGGIVADKAAGAAGPAAPPAGQPVVPPLPTGGVTVPGYDRKIIKNAEISLQVQDTNVALDALTGLATEYEGYIVNSRTWYEGTYRLASVTLSVPVDSFEQVMRRLRGLAVKVLSEQATGQDVTDQYVDLESRQRNLEATAARIKSFLDSATTVKDALEVNQQLSQIEGQIEDVKGKLGYLKARAAFSNINISLEPERPKPTPTPIPAWTPGETFTEAGSTLLSILRVLGDLVIWVAVILLPFLVPLAIVIWLLVRWTRGRRERRAKSRAPDAG